MTGKASSSAISVTIRREGSRFKEGKVGSLSATKGKANDDDTNLAFSPLPPERVTIYYWPLGRCLFSLSCPLSSSLVSVPHLPHFHSLFHHNNLLQRFSFSFSFNRLPEYTTVLVLLILNAIPLRAPCRAGKIVGILSLRRSHVFDLSYNERERFPETLMYSLNIAR